MGKSVNPVQGQRGPKRGFSDFALWRSRGRVALRRCDAPGGGWRCDAATLRRCRWASDAATLLALRDAATLRRWSDAATLLALRRCDAATRERRCDAATLLALRRCDAGATLRRCWRCDASFRKSAHGVASRRDTETPIEDRQCRSLYKTGPERIKTLIEDRPWM